MQTSWPYCNITQCRLHSKCQSEQSILMRVLRDDEESKDIFKSCQNVTEWSVKNGHELPN